MIKGIAKQDFRVGPLLHLRGHQCEVPHNYAHMVDPIIKKIEEEKEKILDNVVEYEQKVAKKVSAKRKNKAAKAD